MKGVFSTLFREELRTATDYYAAINPRLGEDFVARVKAAVRTVLLWQGGDHVGPHGFSVPTGSPAASAAHFPTCSTTRLKARRSMSSVSSTSDGIPTI